MAAAVPIRRSSSSSASEEMAAAGRKGHPGHLGCQLAVQCKVCALHGTIAGDVGIDDGGAAGIGQPLAKGHARLGADVLPPVDGHIAVLCIHPYGDLIAVFLQHPGGKGKIRYRHAAQDAAPHPEGEVFFDALLGTDAAAYLDV